MKNILIFEHNGLQYFYNGNNSIIKSNKKEKKKIKINKIIFFFNKGKIFLGKPYIKKISIKINLFFIKKKKKTIIKFKRRKRYKIIKKIIENKYKFFVEKIRWLKKKQ
ncbi:bL21 family ribosomal protein [Candidatus Vidania fulgoroideorum]